MARCEDFVLQYDRRSVKCRAIERSWPIVVYVYVWGGPWLEPKHSEVPHEIIVYDIAYKTIIVICYDVKKEQAIIW